MDEIIETIDILNELELEEIKADLDAYYNGDS